MNQEYVIISKTAIQKRIEELEKCLRDEPNPFINISYQTELDTLIRVLSQSTPLIPEIEKSFDAGWKHNQFPFISKNKQGYISNLKLDI